MSDGSGLSGVDVGVDVGVGVGEWMGWLLSYFAE